MDQTDGRTELKTAFISATGGEVTARLAEMLHRRGIEALTLGRTRVGHTIAEETIRLIGVADFVVVVLPDASEPGALFNLGLARGMGKPVFVLSEGPVTVSDIRGVYVRVISGVQDVEEVGSDLDRFLRHAKRPELPQDPPPARRIDLAWAREELERQRSAELGARAEAFELLVARIFSAVGAETQSLREEGPDAGADFVVWLNDVAFAVGGPILIECKILHGGVGSVLKNAEVYARKLERALSRSDAILALLIFDHSRPYTPSTPFATPDVLPFSIDDLISGFEEGTFQQEVVRRRRRSAVTANSAS